MKKIVFTLTFIFSYSILSAQIIDASVKKQLQDFDKYVDQTLKDWNVPSAGVAIVKDGEVVWAKGYGMKDVEGKVAATEYTQYAIGSSSKAFTAAAVCLLADEGSIDLDKPLKNYLEDFELWDEYASENMTPRDLLCHRSGLPRHDLVWYGTDKSRDEIFQTLKHLEPTATFRETWQYQNLMFMTAGYLVEKVSGKSWEDFVKAEIFAPLEMKTANFSVNDIQKANDYALPYRDDDGKLIKMPYRNIDAIGPAGSINANVMEMSNWVIMQLAKGKFGEKEVLSPTMIQQMHTPHMVMPGTVSDEVFYNSYGLGWFITSYRGHLRVEHGGNIDGFSANVCLMPRDSIGVVVLTNMNGTRATSIIRNAAVDRMLELDKIDWNERLLKQKKEAEKKAEDNSKEEPSGKVEGTQPSHELSAYAGNFEHPAYGKILVAVKDGKLNLKTHGFDFMLNHYHYDIFESDDPLLGKQKIAFHSNLQGEIFKITAQMQPGVGDIEYKRIVEISEETLSLYAGEYELNGMIVKISIKEGVLKALVTGQPEYTLAPMQEAHAFQLEGLSGFSLKFKVKDGEKASEAAFHQPNGVFTAKRKE